MFQSNHIRHSGSFDFIASKHFFTPQLPLYFLQNDIIGLILKFEEAAFEICGRFLDITEMNEKYHSKTIKIIKLFTVKFS